MSENTPENNNENLDQEEQQGQTQGEEQGQNDQKPIQGEKVEPEDTPEEVKEEARKLGKGEPDAYYKISEEEYEKMKKHVPEDLQKTITDSKVKNGVAPQCWLPAINGLAFGLIAFVPGLNIAYGAVLLANLKILPMLSAKKVENSVKSLPSSFKSDNNDKKQQFGTRKTGSSPAFFGTAETNPSPETETKEGSTVKFGTADNNNSVLDSLKKINQSFGTGKSSSSPTPHTEKLEELKKTVKKPSKVDTPPR